MHLYQLCYNARRMDRHSEAELWAREYLSTRQTCDRAGA